jgi:DNA-binding LacI/PurR family transcriptional regulator
MMVRASTARLQDVPMMQTYDRIRVLVFHRMEIAQAQDETAPAPEGTPAPGPRRTVTTMRDIARAAGVSQSTVSRVLNDAPTSVPIAPETRARVLQAARDLGYRPNPLARGLRGAPTMLIGAVVRDFSDPFWAGAVEALAVEAMGHGYNIVLGHAQGRLDEGIALTTVLETRHTDAIVLLGDMQDQPRLLADLRQTASPVVALWQGSSPVEFPTAEPDDRAGILAGLEHVRALGHERIAFVSAHLQGDFRIREDAYVEFMDASFGGVPDGYLQRCPNTLAGGEEALSTLLDLDAPPTAICTSTDLVAIGVLHAAHGRGRTVPDRLSVVGFDDILISAHTVPALTTIRMPIAEMVRHAVALAIELAREPSAQREPVKRLFEPSLVVRQSTAPPMPPAASI